MSSAEKCQFMSGSEVGRGVSDIVNDGHYGLAYFYSVIFQMILYMDRPALLV